MSKPTLFVGSSTEGLDIARAIQEQLAHDAEVTLWSDSVFDLGKGTLEALLESAERFDFATLVITPDDIATIRGKTVVVPRDNVVFELGLFMGRLGRERTFAVCDRQLPIWNDLTGITVAHFDRARSDGNLLAALGPACNQIRRAMARQGVQGATTSVADFWKPFLSEASVIVLGHFAMPHFEGSGLLGFGDAMALLEIQGYCDHVQCPHPLVRDAKQLAPDDRGKHLILIGGADVNRLTETVLDRIAPMLNPSVDAVEDLLTRARYCPTRAGTEITQDIGVIIEAPNPFDKEKRALLLFGCYGYGSWAAARFSKTGAFLDALQTSRDVECVIETEVIQGSPYAIRPAVLRHRQRSSPSTPNRLR